MKRNLAQTALSIVDYYQRYGVLVDIRHVVLCIDTETEAKVQKVIAKRIEHIDFRA